MSFTITIICYLNDSCMVNVQWVFSWNSTMKYNFINMIFLNRLIQDFCFVGKSKCFTLNKRHRCLPFRIRVINPSKVLLKIADLTVTDFQNQSIKLQGLFNIKEHFHVMKQAAVVIFIHLLRQTHVEEKLYDYLHAMNTLFK